MEKVNNTTLHWAEKNIFVFPYQVANINKKNTLVNDIITKFKEWHINYPNSTNSLYEIFEISWITTIKASTHQYLLNLKQLSTNLAFAINCNWNPTLPSEINFNLIKNMISTSPQHHIPNYYHLSNFLKISQVHLFFYKNKLIINQLQNSNNTKIRFEGDFKISFLYTSIITIIFIIVSSILMIFGLSLYFKINKNSITLKNLEPPVSYRDIGILENVDENNPTKSSPTQLNPLNTLV